MTDAYAAALAAVNALSINRPASPDHADRLIREDVRKILDTYRAAVEAPCPHRREVGDEVWCELGDRDHLENDPVYVAMEESE